MRLCIVLLALVTSLSAVDLYTSGFVSENFAKADVSESSQSSEILQQENEKEDAVFRTENAERRVMKTKGKEANFKGKPFVAAGLFLCGAATGYFGYDANEDATFYHSEYKKSTEPQDVISNRQKVEDAESKRNIFYALSGASLLGVTVTLTLF